MASIPTQEQGGPGWTTIGCECPCVTTDICFECIQPTTVCVRLTNITVGGAPQPDVSGNYTFVPGQPGVQGQLIFTSDGTGGVVSWGCDFITPSNLGVTGQFGLEQWGYSPVPWACSPFSIGPLHISSVPGSNPPGHFQADLMVTAGAC